MAHNLICINCPQGCHLTAEKNSDGSFRITGNRCPRGVKYAEEELTDPRRVVTAVVKTENGSLPYLPVRTNAALPKKMIANLLNRLYCKTVSLPVKRGAVILEDVGHTGIHVIASEEAK